MNKHTSGPWSYRAHGTQCFDHTGAKRQGFQIVGPEPLGDMECGAFNEADARLMAASPELLEVAVIEQQLHLAGYTKATARKLGPEAEEAYLISGVPGLNDWRRRKRESAIAKAEGH